MTYSWKRNKGIINENNCPKCHGCYPDDEYEFDDDLCTWCLFPEALKKAPSEKDKVTGINVTQERLLLDNLDEVVEKQSKAAKKKMDSYKQKSYLKNRKA